jgi:hypothetical protein
LDTKIADKISVLSDELRYVVTGDPNGILDGFPALKCCVYGVLSWLEKKKYIQSSLRHYQERQGLDMISNEDKGADQDSVGHYIVHDSYPEQYRKWLRKLLPKIIGSHNQMAIILGRQRNIYQLYLYEGQY